MTKQKYIVDLTNHLIRKHDFKSIREKTKGNQAFLTLARIILESDDVRSMSPKKLGEIICSVETGDLMMSKADLFENLHFSGDASETLREMVAICLSHVICDRLTRFNTGSSMPPYERRTNGVGF